MKTNYKHISKVERKRIEELTQGGKTNRYPRVKPVVLQVAFCDRTAPNGADLLEKSFSFSSKDLSPIFVALLRNKNPAQA